jgi:hypothetical protein
MRVVLKAAAQRRNGARWVALGVGLRQSEVLVLALR